METELIRAVPLDARADADLARAAKIIRDGGLVVFPTETVYGLGADATSAPAAAKIYAAKGRPSDNPLIIHVARPEDAARYTETNATYDALARAFMPGPLTVILRSKENIPKTTRGGLDTVAVRCPSHPVAHRLIELAGVPIAAPSANLSGSPSPTDVAHVIDDMRGRVDMIIDGGASEFGLESTIVKVEDDGSLTLLRPGRITPEELSAVIPVVHIAGAVTEQLKDGEVALSPGMKYRHYAPKCPVFLLDGRPDAVAEYLKTREGRIAVIAYTEDIAPLRGACQGADFYDFGARADELAQAHRLFYLLREADKKNYDAVYAPLPPTDGVGLALYNRMIRAAAHQIVRL